MGGGELLSAAGAGRGGGGGGGGSRNSSNKQQAAAATNSRPAAVAPHTYKKKRTRLAQVDRVRHALNLERADVGLHRRHDKRHAGLGQHDRDGVLLVDRQRLRVDRERRDLKRELRVAAAVVVVVERKRGGQSG